MEKLAQFDDEFPIIHEQNIISKDEGFDKISKAFGVAAHDAAEQASRLGTEASSANLLSAHSSLMAVSQNTKANIEQDPLNTDKYLQQANDNALIITQNAYINPKDKSNLDYISNNMMTELRNHGNEKKLSVQTQTAKYRAYRDSQSNLQTIHDTLYLDPKAAQILADKQFDAIQGYVKSGIFTAAEAEHAAKPLVDEINRAKARGILVETNDGDARHIAALNSFQPNPAPYSNAGDPVNEHSASLGEIHNRQMSLGDMRAQLANGVNVSTFDMRNLSDAEYAAINVYKQGAAVGNGILFSNQSWDYIKHEQKKLNSEYATLTDFQKGTKARLNNVINSIEKEGGYFKFVQQTPLGAAAMVDYQLKDAVIDNTVYNGTKDEIAAQRNIDKGRNLNDMIRSFNSIGIGMNIPDQYRNIVPEQIVNPVKDMFNNGGDVNAGVKNIALLTKDNIPYLARVMADERKYQTVYELGKGMGLLDKGFIGSFVASQQDGLKYDEERFQKDNSNLSFGKLKDKILADPNIVAMMNGFTYLNNSAQMKSAAMDKAVRYVRYMAQQNNDLQGSNIDSVIENYGKNIGRVYPRLSSFNYSFDTNVIPLQDQNEASALSVYALNQTYKKMREYMDDAQLEDYISANKPYVINTPSGRVVTVNMFNQMIPDKDGNPAFSQLYDGSLQSAADHHARVRAKEAQLLSNPFMIGNPTPDSHAAAEQLVLADERKRAKEAQEKLEQDVRLAKPKSPEDIAREEETKNLIRQSKNNPKSQEESEAEYYGAKGRKAAKKYKVKELLEEGEKNK